MLYTLAQRASKNEKVIPSFIQSLIPHFEISNDEEYAEKLDEIAQLFFDFPSIAIPCLQEKNISLYMCIGQSIALCREEETFTRLRKFFEKKDALTIFLNSFIYPPKAKTIFEACMFMEAMYQALATVLMDKHLGRQIIEHFLFPNVLDSIVQSFNTEYEEISPGAFEACGYCLCTFCDYNEVVDLIAKEDDFIEYLYKIIDEEMEIESKSTVLDLIIKLCLKYEHVMDIVDFASKAMSILRCENDFRLLYRSAHLISIYGKRFKGTIEDVITLIALSKCTDKKTSRNSSLAANLILQNNPNFLNEMFIHDDEDSVSIHEMSLKPKYESEITKQAVIRGFILDPNLVSL